MSNTEDINEWAGSQDDMKLLLFSVLCWHTKLAKLK